MSFSSNGSHGKVIGKTLEESFGRDGGNGDLYPVSQNPSSVGDLSAYYSHNDHDPHER